MGPRWEEEGRKRSGGPQVYLKGTDMRVRFKGRGLEVSATEHSCGRHGLAFISTSAPVSFAKVVLQAVGIVLHWPFPPGWQQGRPGTPKTRSRAYKEPPRACGGLPRHADAFSLAADLFLYPSSLLVSP